MPGQSGRDVFPDGCVQVYRWQDGGFLQWSEDNGSCGIRAPLTNQDIDWVDKNGTRHAGITKAERDLLFHLYGEIYNAAQQNVPATDEQLARVRQMLGTKSESLPATSGTAAGGQSSTSTGDGALQSGSGSSEPDKSASGSAPSHGAAFWIALAAAAWFVMREV